MSLNARKLCDSWLKTFWSPRIPLPFVTAFRFLHLQPKREDQRPPKIQITFCVRGVISPLLANVYLHYAFDLWVNVWRNKWAQCEPVAVRYADDVILDFSIGRTLIVSWRIYGNDWPCLDWNYTQIRRAGSSSADLPKRTGNVEEKGNPRRSTF